MQSGYVVLHFAKDVNCVHQIFSSFYSDGMLMLTDNLDYIYEHIVDATRNFWMEKHTIKHVYVLYNIPLWNKNHNLSWSLVNSRQH